MPKSAEAMALPRKVKQPTMHTTFHRVPSLSSFMGLASGLPSTLISPRMPSASRKMRVVPIGARTVLPGKSFGSSGITMIYRKDRQKMVRMSFWRLLNFLGMLRSASTFSISSSFSGATLHLNTPGIIKARMHSHTRLTRMHTNI